MDTLYKSLDDFNGCVESGLATLQDESFQTPPDKSDEEAMRTMLAIFITATISLDPKAAEDPDFKLKIASIRGTLLAAYNLGKRAFRRNLAMKTN